MDGTIAELVNSCKRIKSTKELPVVKKPSHKKTGKDHNKGGKKGFKKRKPKGEGSSEDNCKLHRPNKTHNTEDCYSLKYLVKGATNGRKDPGQK